MKNILYLFFVISLTLSACRTATPQSAPPAQIGTLTVTTTATQTSTSTITPLPTIPTFTATFDVSTIVTVTPAQKAECPKEDASVVGKFATPKSDGSFEIYRVSDILDYLNSGGTAALLRDSGLGEIVDLNGDDVNEVVYRGIIRSAYIILGCKDGKYQDFLDFAGDSGVSLADALDLNKNGIPEIILYNIVHYGYVNISVFESDGNKFHSLINLGKYSSTDDAVIDWVSATSLHKIMDTNGDGLKEIVVVYDVNQLCGGFGDFCDGTPAREQTTILGWNDQNYVVKQENYTSAQYRFQTVQDGDREVLYGNYEIASKHYRDAIFDSSLEWWTEERKDYEVKLFYDSYNPITPLPSPYPLEDKSEFPSLASYAYYRIMLLQFVQGQETEANQTYQTLQDTFGNDIYAQPYIEMTTEFLQAYQVNQSMYDGCAAAIQYAVEHPEILLPLGSDYHGSQSKIYEPQDVCPFR